MIINKRDEIVLEDLCIKLNQVIVEVLKFEPKFRYSYLEGEDYYIISNKTKVFGQRRFDLNMRLYKDKENNNFLYAYILWFSVNPKKMGLGSIIINEIIEVLKESVKLEFYIMLLQNGLGTIC